MKTMIRTDALRPDPQAAANVLSYAMADCELGKVLVARSDKGVCAILLGEDVEALTVDLAARFPQATRVLNEAAVKDDLRKILAYIAEPANGLKLTLDMRGTPFQRRIWERLTTIAAGQTVTYADIAQSLFPLSHPRAVAGACAANSIALAVPCHRVVRSDGDLAGYRWGLSRKRTLIEKEAAA